ncbi:YgiT-type zinc finger protein [Bacillus sp. PK3-037]|uniref:YgiT-type zinc finger protein n=1 Tax=Bacillus stercoris TaxID=2054641 RepID=UPI002DB6757F|nr:YgiT-type zinc finger protein [Bacillus stercoris]MEC2109989.1 YgiT-type zinc finger protein [Bacillus stercoris]
MATLTVSASKVGGSIRPAKMLCECGEKASLSYFNKIGRFGDSFVTVKNVPVYKCSECDEEIVRGADSLKFFEKTKEAVKKGLTEIEFE